MNNRKPIPGDFEVALVAANQTKIIAKAVYSLILDTIDQILAELQTEVLELQTNKDFHNSST